MTWKNRKRLAMVRIQLRKTLKYLLHVGFTDKKDRLLPIFLLYELMRMHVWADFLIFLTVQGYPLIYCPEIL